jgi:hypothetical protein
MANKREHGTVHQSVNTMELERVTLTVMGLVRRWDDLMENMRDRKMANKKEQMMAKLKEVGMVNE